MASALYKKAKELSLTDGLNLDAGDVKCMVVDTDEYTVDLDADQFLDDIPGPGQIAASENLTTKTVVAGVFDADDADLGSPASSPDAYEAVVVYVDTGDAATSPLIAYIDSGAGLPLHFDGGPVSVQWNASGIFEI